MTGRPGRRRESYAERRERRAAIDDPQVVFEAALRFLEARSRSVGEVRRRLTTAGYRPELVDGAISRLGDLGLLDDAAFGSAWLESRDRARPRGELALRRELLQKGLERGLVDELLTERREGATGAGDGEGDGDATGVDEAAALRLIARHERALARVADPRARRQRAYALLARNGFAPDVAAEVSRRLVDHEEVEE